MFQRFNSYLKWIQVVWSTYCYYYLCNLPYDSETNSEHFLSIFIPIFSRLYTVNNKFIQYSKPHKHRASFSGHVYKGDININIDTLVEAHKLITVWQLTIYAKAVTFQKLTGKCGYCGKRAVFRLNHRLSYASMLADSD